MFLSTWKSSGKISVYSQWSLLSQRKISNMNIATGVSNDVIANKTSQLNRRVTQKHFLEDLFRHSRNPEHKNTVAFVLSGGANRGAAQVGMLAALIDRGIQPDMIFGSSVGALNAVAFAAAPTQNTISQLDNLWTGLRKEDIFPPQRFGTTWRYAQKRPYVFPNDALANLIKANISIANLSQTKIPVEIVLTRASDGVPKRISTGDPVAALLASAALPGTFPPVKIGEESYIDGGIADDVPLYRAVELGATTIYVLLCGSMERDNKIIVRPIEAILDSFTLAKLARLRTDLKILRDKVSIVLLQSSFAQSVAWLDFTHSQEMIQDGYRSTLISLDSPINMPLAKEPSPKRPIRSQIRRLRYVSIK